MPPISSSCGWQKSTFCLLAGCSLHLYTRDITKKLLDYYYYYYFNTHTWPISPPSMCWYTPISTFVKYRPIPEQNQLLSFGYPPHFAGLLPFYIMQQWLCCSDQSDCMRGGRVICLLSPVGVAYSLTLCTRLRLQPQIMGHCVRPHEVEYPQGCWVDYAE